MKYPRSTRPLLLLLAPLFIQGVCNKSNTDVPAPTSDEYATWSIAGGNGSFSVPADSITLYRFGSTTSVYGMTRTNASTYFEISFEGPQQSGNYPATSFQVLAGGKYYVPTATPVQVNVSTYGATGGYVIGTYSGPVKDSATAATVNVSGSFRVKNR